MRQAAAFLTFLAATAVQAQVPAGGEFQVQTSTVNWFATQPTVSVEHDGDFLIVWMSLDMSGGGSGYDAFAQRFDATGARRGGEFRVNTYTTGDQGLGSPDVDVDRLGNSVVVWSADPEPGGAGRGNFGQRYDAAGHAIGGEFHVNTFTAYHQSQQGHGPRVAMAPAGQFVVVWDSVVQDGDNYGVFARRYDAAGNPLGAEFQVSTTTAGRQLGANVDMDADGNFVIVWAGDSVAPGLDVFAQRFDAAGNRRGGEFRVNTSTLGNQGYFGQGDPKVAVAADGAFVVVWQDVSANPIRGQRFDRAGNRVGGEFTIDPSGNVLTSTSVGMDALGNLVASWYEGQAPSSFNIQAQRVSASGALRGGPFTANASVHYNLISSVECDDVGNFVIAWDERHHPPFNGPGIFAQRFGGLRPHALAVDAAGNRVLDPGETAVMQPSWRNINGASLAFAGTLTEISGPAGPAYAITDGAADHGTVANAASSACTDCYAVQVSGPRPATHWDASAVETITPDALGQQKQWVLHVGGSFGDVSASSPFYRFIETLLHRGVTGGCTPSTFCPSSTTTRAQMAVFALVAREGPGYAPPACVIGQEMFSDLPASSPYCRWVEELARRGVVAGCGNGQYCPVQPVAREQMAIFALSTLEGPAYQPPACGTPMYADVPASSPFCRWIEELTRRGVVSGCGGGNFCPGSAVSREQMGVFLSVTFGLTLYGP
jgi:S-layer family protein